MIEIWIWFKTISGITRLKLTVSTIALICIILRLIWPSLNIDAVTFGLLLVAILPWLSSLIESAKFPGGWEVKFRDIQSAGAKVTSILTPSIAQNSLPKPAFLSVADLDPNLALVGLRIEIETRLRKLTAKHGIRDERSLMRMFNELLRTGVLNDASMSGLQELVMAGNQAAHGASVEKSVAQWAVDYGPEVLAALDQKINEVSG
jgi:hypothetical protein